MLSKVIWQTSRRGGLGIESHLRITPAKHLRQCWALTRPLAIVRPGALAQQDSEPVASPTPSWRVRIACLLGALCGRDRSQLIGSTSVVDRVRTPMSSCSRLRRRIADTGLSQPLTSGSYLQDYGLPVYPINPHECTTLCSAYGDESSSMNIHNRHRSASTRTCTPSAACGAGHPAQDANNRNSLSSQLVDTADSALSSQASSCIDTVSVVPSLLDSGLLQLKLQPLPTWAQAAGASETQPIGIAMSLPRRQISKASLVYVQLPAHSTIPIHAHDQPQIPSAYPDCLGLDNLCSHEDDIVHYYLMQPYQEEKRTWLQMKWQQQQDWLEQQVQVDPFSPRQLLRQGSRSLNVRAVQQSGILIVSGDIEEARNAQLSLVPDREEQECKVYGRKATFESDS